MKSALILYPNQLFPADQLPDVHTVILVEEPLFFGVDQQQPLRLHKQKLIHHFASMRRYVEEVLWPAGYEVDYVELDVFMSTGDILEKAKRFEHLYIFEPTDEVMARRLLKARREKDKLPVIEFLPNPNFYLKDQDVRQYFNERHKHLFEDFYQWQRERFDILIGGDYKPVGGKWLLDKEKSKQPSREHALPNFAVYGGNQFVAEAAQRVEAHFPDNPGSTNFVWPTNHEEADAWLQDFVNNRLDGFSEHAETIDAKAPWLYHSALSACLNTGLLSPQQAVSAALSRHQKHPVNLASLELFVRHILGWREFMRGIYLVNNEGLKKNNGFNHQRRLTAEWYDGTTGIVPFDDMVSKLKTHAYVHQAERFRIAANLMVLCEIHPDDMQQWFGSLFIDAYEWVLIPNIYAVNNFVHGATWANRPCISSSNTILQISDYERDEWSDIWDGLFWRFIEKHRSVLSKHPSLRMMVQRLDRLDADRRRIIGYRADDFLNQFTK